MKRWIPVFLALLTMLDSHPPGLAETGNPQVTELKSPDANTRAKAARALGKSGDASAVAALAAALTDPSNKVRREVILALASIHRSESLEALIPATKDMDADLKALAVQSLVGYYSGQTPSPGFTGMVKKGLRRAKSRFVQDKTQVDPGTVVEAKVITALQEVMAETRSAGASREAAKGLGILLARNAVPDLVQAAHSSDEDLAREALNALSKIKDKSSGPQLTDLLDSPNRDIKRDAAVTVGVLRTEEALPKLQTIAETDPDPKDKQSAIEGLAYLGNRLSVPLFIKSLWDQNSKEIRTSAAEGLARAKDPQSLSELERAAIAEKDLGVKLAIEFAITTQGKDDYLSAMVDELASKLRGDAAEAYLIELSRDPKFLPKLYPYLQSHDPAARRRLCRVMMYTGDATSLEALDRLSHDPNGDVATMALRAKQAIRSRGSSPTP